MRRLVIGAAIALITFLASALHAPVSAAAWQQTTQPLDLIKIINTGGIPDKITIDTWQGQNDLLFYDLADYTVKYVDGDTLAVLTDEVSLPSWSLNAWMATDPYYGHTYVLQVVRQQDDDEQPWQEVIVNVLNRRMLLASFSVNAQFNEKSAVDTRSEIAGFVVKPAYAESEGTARLLIDNTYGGTIDVVDLDTTGVRVSAIQRWSYRSPLATDKWWTLRGNSLALETRHETLALDDLGLKDILYLLDGNTAATQVRVLIVRQAAKLDVVEMQAINFANSFPFSNGVQGLFVNGPTDRLLIGSALQSFDQGMIGSVRTTDHEVEMIPLRYADPGFVLADWYDPKRIFVTAFDGFWNDPDHALYVRLLYGDETYSLVLDRDWTEEPRVRDMAFDPYHRRLYIAVESNEEQESEQAKHSRIYVVEVNVGAGAPPLLLPRPAVATGVLFSPWYGGTINAPSERATILFPANSVSSETQVVYAETLSAPLREHLVVRAFDLTAVATADGQPVTAFLKPYWVTLRYTDAELGPVDEATLVFATWDGARWVPVQGAQMDAANNEIVVSLDHMSRFAILGDAPEQSYLPALQR